MGEGILMKLWDEYGYEVADTTLDDEGNPMVEMTIYLKIAKGVEKSDIVNGVQDLLEGGLK
jgi:hypothetical protein